MNEIFEFVKTKPVVITPDWVCRLHKELMSSSRINVLDMNGNRKLNHIVIGATRQSSCVNVGIQTSLQGRPLRIQFCPYDSVDGELDTFCMRFTVFFYFIFILCLERCRTWSLLFLRRLYYKIKTSTLSLLLLGLATSSLLYIRLRYDL